MSTQRMVPRPSLPPILTGKTYVLNAKQRSALQDAIKSLEDLGALVSPSVPDPGVSVGRKMLCDILVGGKKSGEQREVQVVEIKRAHQSQEPRSVRVKTLEGKTRFIWVQPDFLHAPPRPFVGVDWALDDSPHVTHFAVEAERNEPSIPDAFEGWRPKPC